MHIVVVTSFMRLLFTIIVKTFNHNGHILTIPYKQFEEEVQLLFIIDTLLIL